MMMRFLPFGLVLGLFAIVALTPGAAASHETEDGDECARYVWCERSGYVVDGAWARVNGSWRLPVEWVLFVLAAEPSDAPDACAGHAWCPYAGRAVALSANASAYAAQWQAFAEGAPPAEEEEAPREEDPCHEGDAMCEDLMRVYESVPYAYAAVDEYADSWRDAALNATIEEHTPHSRDCRGGHACKDVARAIRSVPVVVGDVDAYQDAWVTHVFESAGW